MWAILFQIDTTFLILREGEGLAHQQKTAFPFYPAKRTYPKGISSRGQGYYCGTHLGPAGQTQIIMDPCWIFTARKPCEIIRCYQINLAFHNLLFSTEFSFIYIRSTQDLKKKGLHLCNTKYIQKQL